MKVLKDNYNDVEKTIYYDGTLQIRPYPRNLICDNCGSELEYEKSDMRMGVFGCMHLECPCCGYDNMLEDNEKNIVLTADNVEFPTHFWHTSVETGAVDCCNNEYVKRYITEGIEYLRKHRDEHDIGFQSGNLYVDVGKNDYDKEYIIIVANDYYEANIPFEDADY